MKIRNAIRAAAALIAGLLFSDPTLAEPCFRGRPDCRSYLVFEVSYARSLGGEGMHYGIGEFGYMRNRSDRWALGGTVLVGVRGSGQSEIRGGASVRARRWLQSGNSIDLSSGPLVASADGLTRLGGAAEVLYNIHDRVHLTTRWEYVKMPGENESSLCLGAGLGSKPALIIGGIVGVVLGGLALAWD